MSKSFSTCLNVIQCFIFVVESAWYLPSEMINVSYVIETSFGFLVVFYYIIPISLYVTIEIQTFFGSKFFVWDKEMFCPETGEAPLCNTSDLNAELGQIEYLFSDKTGTLTENIMEFRYSSINGCKYRYNHGQLFVEGREEAIDLSHPEEVQVQHFLKTLALCHTVQILTDQQKMKRLASISAASKKLKRRKVENDDDSIQFQASSPDELALLNSCSALGIKFLGDENEILTLDVLGKTETYRRHFILEFDAERKCMSVILENEKGEFFLLTKGAESTILRNGLSGCVDHTRMHVDNFATMGLRTLVVAERKLSRYELEAFSKKVNNTNRLVQHREEKMRALYSTIESNLHVLGSTGVEDQLQDGVQDTLTALSQAGIRIWILTGDKVETAISVAIACGLLPPTNEQVKIIGFIAVCEIKRHLQLLTSEARVNEYTTIIMDGESLSLAFESCRENLCSVLLAAGGVICSRLAPFQKAQIVEMVKATKTKPVTAAVGDGANDVAMIQEAHVGIGIFGKEGRQAARSADFAVARFSFIKKAILVHGHFFYVRLSVLILYFFYKNVVLILPPALSAFHNAFSSQSLINAFFMTFFNVTFSAAPILAYGLQEQPYSPKVLIQNPSLYKNISQNCFLTWKCFSVWMVRAIWHSLILYFCLYFSLEGLFVNDWWSYGVTIVTGVVGVVNIMLLFHTKYFTGWNLFAYGFSFITYVSFTTIYTEANLKPVIDSSFLHHTYFMTHRQTSFWLYIVLTIVLAVTPDIVVKSILNFLKPNLRCTFF